MKNGELTLQGIRTFIFVAVAMRSFFFFCNPNQTNAQHFTEGRGVEKMGGCPFWVHVGELMGNERERQ